MTLGNCWREAIVALLLVAGSSTAHGAEEANKPCTEDAMIVFDASGSMAGSLAEGIGAKIRRIDEVRKALAQVLPNVAHFRRIGLVTYGPGPQLAAEGAELTVHVIGFGMTAFWTGGQSAIDVRCIAEATGGLHIGTNSQEELVEAFQKTLGCAMMSAVGTLSR